MNGVKLKRPKRLEPGDIVKIGEAISGSNDDAAASSSAKTDHRAASAGTTRTSSSANRRSSRSRTGWAERRPERWPRGSPRRRSRRARTGRDGEERVNALIQEANRRVYEKAQQDMALAGMGTTLTLALVDERHGHLRPRRRLARLPAPRRQARADHRRPLARRRADARAESCPRRRPRRTPSAP